LQARAWHCEGSFAYTNNDFERATDLFRRALDARRGDRPDDAFERAWIVRSLSGLAELRGDADEASSLSEQAAAMFHELGDVPGMLRVAQDRALFCVRRGDYGRARALLRENVAQARELDEHQLATFLIDVGMLELREHRYAEAVPIFLESLERALERSLRVHVAVSLRGLAATAAADGQLDAAARMLGTAGRIDEETGLRWEPFDREVFDGPSAPVLERADEPEIGSAWAAGRAMSDAEAVAYALATVSARMPG
jgi:ATP/maltotriose-dependent transcriptional regulator MalT